MFKSEMLGSIQQVGQIKVLNVVAGDYVRVDLSNEIGPALKRCTSFI